MHQGSVVVVDVDPTVRINRERGSAIQRNTAALVILVGDVKRFWFLESGTDAIV